mmetsp:Transcript_35258/g.99807  ORF Transcript_35258/g.99807 Transcript_35258/m.99807 type:complete len:216 (+) Transcript_35258:1404-2051(+)
MTARTGSWTSRAATRSTYFSAAPPSCRAPRGPGPCRLRTAACCAMSSVPDSAPARAPSCAWWSSPPRRLQATRRRQLCCWACCSALPAPAAAMFSTRALRTPPALATNFSSAASSSSPQWCRRTSPCRWPLRSRQLLWHSTRPTCSAQSPSASLWLARWATACSTRPAHSPQTSSWRLGWSTATGLPVGMPSLGRSCPWMKPRTRCAASLQAATA